MRDLTKGSPAKLILLFTVPLLIGNVFQQFYNMVDMIIVGQTLGKNSLAAVGATGGLTFLIIGFAQGLTAGLAIITAQRYGAKDFRGLKKSFATSVMISVIVTVILTVLSLVFIRPMLQLMQTPADIIDEAQTFIVIILWGIFAAVSFNLLSNVIRALGDSRTPLLFLIVAVIINVVLDLIFIINFGMGVEGAAIATVIAQIASSLLCIVYIKKKIPMLQLRKKDFSFDKQEIRTHLNVALPNGFPIFNHCDWCNGLRICIEQLRYRCRSCPSRSWSNRSICCSTYDVLWDCDGNFCSTKLWGETIWTYLKRRSSNISHEYWL